MHTATWAHPSGLTCTAAVDADGFTLTLPNADDPAGAPDVYRLTPAQMLRALTGFYFAESMVGDLEALKRGDAPAGPRLVADDEPRGPVGL